jgi:hypothetical protein
MASKPPAFVEVVGTLAACAREVHIHVMVESCQEFEHLPGMNDMHIIL